MAPFSSGTLDMIFATRGVLTPTQLHSFLKAVRGRRKAAEIASHFTSDINGLVNQLDKVITKYYEQNRRGAAMDRDIKFIQRLCVRLQRNDDSPEHRTFERSYSMTVSRGTVVASASSYEMTYAEAEWNQSSRSGSLSRITYNAISNTRGPLPPLQLRDFLDGVRGRQKAREFANHFTRNIPALVTQLQELEDDCYEMGNVGPEINRDVSFIRRLWIRLERNSY